MFSQDLAMVTLQSKRILLNHTLPPSLVARVLWSFFVPPLEDSNVDAEHIVALKR